MPSSFGNWDYDANGLPVFVLTVQDDAVMESPFTHLIATGKASALLDRHANIRLFTTDSCDGIIFFAGQGESVVTFKVRDAAGELVWNTGRLFEGKRKAVYGIGYAEYTFETQDWTFRLTIAANPDSSKFLDICYSLDPADGLSFSCGMKMLADSLVVQHKAVIPGQSGFLRIGYGDMPPEIDGDSIGGIKKAWSDLLSGVELDAPQKWMDREAIWAMGQLLSFRNYDGLLDEFYMNLGGYAWGEFAGRECSEVSMAMAKWYPQFALENLRQVAKTQLFSGRISRVWDFTDDIDIDMMPPFRENIRLTRPETSKELWASDQEIWFVLGCVEYAAKYGTDFLNQKLPFYKSDDATLFEHCRRAFYWVRDGIGLGRHGLIKMFHGDWNDYLGTVGLPGGGESFMNSGMACRAFEKFSRLAIEMGNNALACDVQKFVSEQRDAMAKCFTGSHFLRGYTDAGESVGEDRVFLNAQTWAVLGGCGGNAMREAALQSAYEKCHSDIGMVLMSKPYPLPAPRNITSCDYAPGEGENAGIWPQTVHWFIWALCEHGMQPQAMDVWRRMSLQNHTDKFPDVAFGIFNGPDCYSSQFSEKTYGATQTDLIDRRGTVPMNPVIAWQAWSLDMILKN